MQRSYTAPVAKTPTRDIPRAWVFLRHTSPDKSGDVMTLKQRFSLRNVPKCSALNPHTKPP